MDEELDVLPLLNTVAYPLAVTPLAVAGAAALRLLDRPDGAPRRLLVAALRHPAQRPGEPSLADCYTVGTIVLVHRLLRLPDGTLRVALEGLERAAIQAPLPGSGLRARVTILPDEPADARAIAARLQSAISDHAAALPQASAEWHAEIAAEDDPARLSFLAAGPLLARTPLVERQRFLEMRDPVARITLLLQHLTALAAPPDPASLHPTTSAPDRPQSAPGYVHWLRWTPQGFVMTPLFAVAFPGYGRVQISGRITPPALMSMQLGVDAVRAHGAAFGLHARRLRTQDVHLHTAEPIDDDNLAGCGGAAALATLSALTQRPLRSDALLLADLDLHGGLLPIRRLSERLLAASHIGISTVVVAPDRPPPAVERVRVEVVSDLRSAAPYLFRHGEEL